MTNEKEELVKQVDERDEQIKQIKSVNVRLDQTNATLRQEVQQLKHLLGSHVDGSRCTCTLIDSGDGYSQPSEWEQDPWCPTHPDMTVILDAVRQLKEDKRNLQISVVELDRQLDG